MHFNQYPTNTIARRASSAEMNRWRDQYVDPELLQPIGAAAVTAVKALPYDGTESPAAFTRDNITSRVQQWIERQGE